MSFAMPTPIEFGLALVVLAAVWIVGGLWKLTDDGERVEGFHPMTRPWQIAALIAAVIFGIRGFVEEWGRRSSKPEIAFVAMAIIGYLVVWLVYLIAMRIRRSV